jgi:hypothetical protein
MGEMKKAYTILAGKPEWEIHVKDLDIDKRIILKRMGRCALESSDSEKEQHVKGCCEYGNEPAGSIKGREFDWLNDFVFQEELYCTKLYSEIVSLYEVISKSFRTGRLQRELQMVQLSATGCSCIAIL